VLPGNVVAMDNLSSHKVAGVRKRIAAVGAELLYLPPYSPDLNPIEKAWAKLKQLLRNAKARTAQALDQWGPHNASSDCHQHKNDADAKKNGSILPPGKSLAASHQQRKGCVRLSHIRAIGNFGSLLTLTDPRLNWRQQMG
jgi:hypothetical protein